MAQEPGKGHGHAIAGLSRGLGVGIALAGLLVLVGWAFDIRHLMTVSPGLVAMKANTALGFVLGGLCLWLSGAGLGPSTNGPSNDGPSSDGPSSDGHSTRGRNLWSAKALALLLGALGALTLAEYGFHRDLGIDQVLFLDTLAAPGTPPGRMAVVTAVNFTLLAAALLLIDVATRTGKRPSNWLALAIAANGYLAVLGYAYNVSALYEVAAMSTVALHTAALFVLASLGVAFARPGSNFVQQVFADNMASQVNRRLLPVAILLPPLMGWLSLQGERAGHYMQEVGLAIFTVGNVVVLTVLAWRSARALQQVHNRQLAVSEVSDWQRAILDSADFTVIATDIDGTIRTINFCAEKKLGYAPGELIGKTPLAIHDAGEVAARAEVLTRELGHEVQPGFEVFVAKAKPGMSDENDWTYICKDGRTFPVRLSVTSLLDAGGQVSGYLGIGSDITQRKQAEARVLYLARFDSLTGLVNRSYFMEKLGEAIARSERDERPLALMFLDLDNFKQINDTFGHHGGDLVLKEFANRLADAVRVTDTVARLAGDEFVIILDLSHDESDASAVADKIVASMQRPFDLLDGQHHQVTACMGIAVRRPGETDPEAFLRRADSVLYRMKSAGRGSYILEW
jgi:diguanylate cyclase (GGDEF)-like protein/PAS domain S-box-containing protein